MIKYKRTASYVTTINGIHLFPGVHIINSGEQAEKALAINEAWKLELETRRIVIVDTKQVLVAAGEGTISLVELEGSLGTIIDKIDAVKSEIKKAKKAKKASTELESELAGLEEQLHDTETAIAIRKSDIENKNAE